MDLQTVSLVVEVKVAVDAILERITAIDKIQGAWESDDEDNLKSNWMSLKLACEYATTELEASRRVCLHILELPPPYTTSSPDERLHKVYEIQARLNRAERFGEDLYEIAQTLVDQCEDGTGEIKEVQVRANDVLSEVGNVQGIAKALVSGVRDRLLDQTAAVLLLNQMEDSS